MRNSNIELLRIVAMLAIIAHHYVVGSTVMELFDPLHPTANQIFFQLWGMWGKTAINVFVLITGYFMCESRLTAKRYCKILFEIVFYSWIMWFLLSVFGYDTITWKGAINRIFLCGITANPNGSFVGGFMWMYLMIPVMNVYIHAASKRNLFSFVGILLAMFTLCGTFLNANVYHHVFWYVTLYFVAAIIRIHPFKWMGRNIVCMPLFLGAMLLSVLSVLTFDFIGWRLYDAAWVYKWQYMVSDSHKILAFTVALLAFLVFKNLRMPQSRLINVVASTTFGVLLIHNATDGMRIWLWQDFVNVPAAYSMPLPSLIGYSVVVMLGVFVVCSALDYLRICIVGSAVLRLSQMADFMVTRGVAWHNCAKLLGRVCWLMR